MKLQHGAGLIVMLTAVAACHHYGLEGEAATTVVTRSDVMTSDAAIAEITGARCDREASCDALAAGGDFPDRGTCMARLDDDARSVIGAEMCPAAIDSELVDSCVRSLKAEPCGKLPGLRYHSVKCQRETLCAAIP